MQTSYEANKDDLLRRLRKMEGQVRGLQQMIEANRYCLDVVQQVNALTAAGREVALLVVEDHMRGCVAKAANDTEREAMIDEMLKVLRKTLRS